MVSANEFSHVVKLSEVTGQAKAVHLSADAEVCAALAKRFDLASLDNLEADLSLTHDADAVVATGSFKATLAQSCIASREAVPATLDEPVHIRFVAEPLAGADSELELRPDDCDTMFHDGQTIDLGEAVAQSLGLALDPYPRSPNAEEALKTAGVKSEEEAGPFGALAALKDRLAGN